MIYSVTRLFSKKEEYLNGKETDFQKNRRKHLTRTLAGLGTVAGASAGLITSKPKNTDRAFKIADNAIKDNKKVLDFTEGIVNKFHEKGGRFKDQQTADAFGNALKWGEHRIKTNRKGIEKAFKVATKMDLKNAGKRSIKGAAIGTAIMAPLAYAANKSIKNHNEELNRSRRGKKNRKNEEK